MKLKAEEPEGLITPEDYIRKRGYVSYSSLKNLRDQNMIDPNAKMGSWADIGTEIHSRFLERTVLKKFDIDTERMLEEMVRALNDDRLVSSLMAHPKLQVEKEFSTKIDGVPVLGYIDIDAVPIFMGDLKSLGHANEKKFIDSMDFLQPALYCSARKVSSFYYIGITKPKFPTKAQVYTFNAFHYPERMEAAFNQLNTLLKYVKSEILTGR